MSLRIVLAASPSLSVLSIANEPEPGYRLSSGAAAGNVAAFAHDDLMIVYLAGPQQQFKADYYDNEGHVIHYAIEFSSDGRLHVRQRPHCCPAAIPATYTQVRAGQVAIKFEIAPPNDPDKFKVYVEGTAIGSGAKRRD